MIYQGYEFQVFLVILIVCLELAYQGINGSILYAWVDIFSYLLH